MPALLDWSTLDPTLLPPVAWAFVASAFLLGSIPFGLLIGRLRGVDLRTVGSGNIGATNAARAMGRGMGLVVYLLDVAKGLVPVLLVGRWLDDPVLGAPVLGAGARELAQGATGLAAVLGHCFTPWLAFKGGKGVATACAAVVAVEPLAFVAGGFAWLLVRATTGWVGLASMAMCAVFPLAWILLHRSAPQPLAAGLVGAWSAIALLVVARHRANIARMLAGTEPRSGRRAGAEASRHGAAIDEGGKLKRT
jgi:glycerol-3-phosphate acyltransferase PlsY